MARTISCLLNNTVLGLDGILNKALKTCGPLIVLQLIDIARTCFVIGYYLRLKRAIITFILHKEGKADYLFLGSYRLIALKNTLKKEVRNSWRWFINKYTTNLSLPHNKGLQRMVKWVKRKVGYLVKDLYLPPLQRLGELLTISNNNEKAKILTERFFP